MLGTTGATGYDVAVALFVVLNTAILAWSTWNATRQRTRIERKVDQVKSDADVRHNGSH